MSGQYLSEKVFSPARLREEIDRRVLSQSEAARFLDVGERSVERWLSGAATPRRAAVRRMGDAFGVDPMTFYVEPEDLAA